eukprot:2953564-Prymnesium_polylepis.1
MLGTDSAQFRASHAAPSTHTVVMLRVAWASKKSTSRVPYRVTPPSISPDPPPPRSRGSRYCLHRPQRDPRSSARCEMTRVHDRNP